MSASVKEAVNIPEWKVALVKKYFQQEEKKTINSVSSAGDAGIEEDFENLFSRSFIENYNADDAFSMETQANEGLKTPRSLKELASKASMNMSNDSGYEGVDSGLKKRKKLEFSFIEERTLKKNSNLNNFKNKVKTRTH